MNEIFNFHGQEVRTMTINDEPWFVGKDVADILGYSKARNAIALHVDEDDALKQGLTDNLGRTQETIIINESGLYSLILSSRLPQAKEFKRWVTSEVLPSIRRQGGFIREDLDEDAFIALFTGQKKLREQQARNAKLVSLLVLVESTVQLMQIRHSLNRSSDKLRLISRIISISVAMTYCPKNSQKQHLPIG